MPKIMKSMNIVSRCQSAYRSERIKGDICGCHHPFVLAICHKPGMSQEEISRELCLNKSTVTRAINQLLERGYVERKANPDDKRSFLIFPTDRMLEILPLVRSVTTEWNELISEGVPKDELEIFISVLNKMKDSARKIVEKCGGVEEK